MHWVRNLCRLCGQVGKNCYDIFDEESGDSLEVKVKKCLNLEISKGDLKPKQICAECTKKLDDFSDFADLCYDTNLKFESAYYTHSWHINEKASNEFSVQHKQTVIVNNKQGFYHNKFYRNSGSDNNITILHTCTLNQPNNVVSFGINNDNSQPCSSEMTFNECNVFVKPENVNPAEQNSFKSDYLIQSKGKGLETVNSCLVNESHANDLLNSVENEFEPLSIGADKCRDPKDVLISIDKVEKSIERQTSLIDVKNYELRLIKSYPCPHCEKKFSRRGNLNAHIAVHTKIRPYTCPSCLKTFAIKCHLTQHQKIHLELYQCQICHKKFTVPSKLKRHFRTHTNEKPYICEFPNCLRAFSDNNNLKHHLATHSEERSVSCDICMKLFKTRKGLTHHIKSHISKAAFMCEFCHKAFKYKHNLRKHVSKHGGRDILKKK